MIYNITNSGLLEIKAKHKQRIEAKLIKRLYEIFNQGEALRNLQDLAGIILDRMGKGLELPFKNAVRKEGNLRVWKKISKVQYSFLVWSKNNKRKYLDATDCADLIRLAGEWVEQGGLANDSFSGKTNTDWQSNRSVSDTIKESYRSGVGGENHKAMVENVWADGKGRFAGVENVRRARGDGKPIEPHVKPFMRDKKAFSGMANKRVRAGIDSKSNIAKLDNIFGLLKGCDISGTTTDTIFALEVFGANLTAGYYLLPLAAIVHNMHHTLIEVATPLSLNKCINYHIGFYSTLKPLSGGLNNELNDISRCLKEAEKLMNNNELHFLNYYDSTNHNLIGAFLFTRSDVVRLKMSNLSNSVTMLNDVRSMVRTPFPSKNEIIKLIKRHIPGGIIPN